MEPLFWASVVFVGYVYVGYPLLLLVWAAVATRPVRRLAPEQRRHWPTVSVVVAARNEGARLPSRLGNLLSLRYPGRIEIIVVSDGSTDDTGAVVGAFREVRFIELPRGGKPLALNAGVAAANGEVIVFTDARQLFAPDAVLALVSNFDDPEVGCVTGELILDCEAHADSSESAVRDGVGVYWRYEKWLRRNESRVWSTLGATGAIYALRRWLWQPLPADTLIDDVLAPMRVVLGGKRTVFEAQARAFDRAAPNTSAEVGRKVRTLAGNYQILRLEPRLLAPFVNPVWVQYASHKIARLLVPWALISALFASAVLAPKHWLYLVALVLQLGFYGLAAVGAWINRSQVNMLASADGSNEPSEKAGLWDSAHPGRSTG